LYHLNDLEDSKDLYEESLKIRRKIFGEDHPDIAESLNNIALIFFKQVIIYLLFNFNYLYYSF
jgi:hypothetical protein